LPASMSLLRGLPASMSLLRGLPASTNLQRRFQVARNPQFQSRQSGIPNPIHQVSTTKILRKLYCLGIFLFVMQYLYILYILFFADLAFKMVNLTLVRKNLKLF
jgi:hypothetical protein